jgi:hypothetical protein
VVDWSEHSYVIEWKPISRWWLVAPSVVSGSACTYNMVPDQQRRKGTINITSLKKPALCSLADKCWDGPPTSSLVTWKFIITLEIFPALQESALRPASCVLYPPVEKPWPATSRSPWFHNESNHIPMEVACHSIFHWTFPAKTKRWVNISITPFSQSWKWIAFCDESLHTLKSQALALFRHCR